MIDEEKKIRASEQKERVRQRIRTKIDRNNYEFIPQKKQTDYYDNDVQQRVAVYARVSTGNIQQTTSYELQKKYYEDFVIHHPNWTLVKIYADEGISGTSLAHRVEFNRMIEDCRAGKIDMVITKSVSRFARNVVDCISMVRTLAEQAHPVGVFFESECIFSLKDDSQMALSFQATMAQEESHIRSRSMETSLRMRLDGGLPLTPKLLGYSHDSEGNLVVNPDEADTVRLVFYMYLYGYTTAEIAEALTELGKKTYLGNQTWSSSTVLQVLRNERHCGDVKTRKTFTPNYLDHKAKKNRGDRPQSIYRDHHEGIISRDDFIAVQRLLDNAKYGNKSILPELRVIDKGILSGFVTINPKWAGFSIDDYFQATAAIHSQEVLDGNENLEPRIEFEAGDFDMRGFEITRAEFFDSKQRPFVSFQERFLKLSSACVRKLGKQNCVEMLINPDESKFAIRPVSKEQKTAVTCSRLNEGVYYSKNIYGGAFMQTIFDIFGWNVNYRYRVSGELYQKEDELVYIFNANDAEVFVPPAAIREGNKETCETLDVKPLSVAGKRIRAVPQEWTDSFGSNVYFHDHYRKTIELQTESDWKSRIQGHLIETGEKINVTAFDELKKFIGKELGAVMMGENYDG